MFVYVFILFFNAQESHPLQYSLWKGSLSIPMTPPLKTVSLPLVFSFLVQCYNKDIFSCLIAYSEL